MELELSLGSPPGRPSEKIIAATASAAGGWTNKGLKLGFCRVEEEKDNRETDVEERRGSADLPMQLNHLPLARSSRHGAPQMGFPWAARESTNLEASAIGFDVNRAPLAPEEAEEEEASSPNSAASSFHLNFAGGGVVGGSAPDLEAERSSSRASDDDDDGGARKKLRLSKEQSAFLEERFKEHSTLNPKQKLALAKQLNLRPRQVEVWFQNRRARTKLKQTEVDCEYLKRCCDALTEENRRLKKELSELRALKTSHPFYMQLPATTLSMCSACERTTKSSTAVAGNPSASAAAAAVSSSGKPTTFFANTRFLQFTGPSPATAHQPSAAS